VRKLQTERAASVEVATQAYLRTNGHNDLPSLTTFDRLPEIVVLGIEEDEVDLVPNNLRISRKILFEGFLDTVINHDFLTFAALLFFDPKSPLDMLIVIQEMVNL
jgi:hypothetical protein